MKLLQWTWGYFKKNFRWLIPAIVFLAWYLFVPNHHWLSFASGVILMGFVWYAWVHYLKGKTL
jgi:hypothetical protein